MVHAGDTPSEGMLNFTIGSVTDGGASPSVMSTGGTIECRLDGDDDTKTGLKTYPGYDISFSGLNGGQAYEVECRAQNAVSNYGGTFSQWVSVLNQTVTTKPGAPQSIQAERSNKVAGRLNFTFENVTSYGGALAVTYSCFADAQDAIAASDSSPVVCPGSNCNIDGSNWKGYIDSLTDGQFYKLHCHALNSDRA